MVGPFFPSSGIFRGKRSTDDVGPFRATPDRHGMIASCHQLSAIALGHQLSASGVSPSGQPSGNPTKYLIRVHPHLPCHPRFPENGGTHGGRS